jgi:hypothetical protein
MGLYTLRAHTSLSDTCTNHAGSKRCIVRGY